MIKQFDRWNSAKKTIDWQINVPNFHEREIWWCVIGVNIGSEQHSQSNDFSRPVIIIKKFTEKIFWGVPLTTKIQNRAYRVKTTLNEAENDILIPQLRVFDRKRLKRKIGMLPEKSFSRLAKEINGLFLEKTNSAFAESSEAEASVCNLSIADQVALSNELTYIASKGEIQL